MAVGVQSVSGKGSPCVCMKVRELEWMNQMELAKVVLYVVVRYEENYGRCCWVR